MTGWWYDSKLDGLRPGVDGLRPGVWRRPSARRSARSLAKLDGLRPGVQQSTMTKTHNELKKAYGL